MELFTLGIGNYAEDDVRAAARAFTGWFFDRNRGFVFNANQHDFGSKTFLGRTGAWDGDDIVNLILDQPAAADFMATKLFTFFVHDHPTAATIRRLAATFRANNYSVRELVRAIFRSPEFSSDEAYHALVKSPVEYLIGTMKLLGVDEYLRGAPGMLQRMGMTLFNPPNVAGWDWGDDWIASATLLERLNTANVLVTQRGDNATYGLNPTALLDRLRARTPADLVDGLLGLLVEGDVPAPVRAALLAYTSNGYSGNSADFSRDRQRLDKVVRGAAHLIMATPVYQMA
jgi:uncharacterized protein (DUF1800 family)